jgi:cytochrome d ubiquinol oxidase subunit I
MVMIVYSKRYLRKGPYYVSPSEARKEAIDPFAKEAF